MRKDNFSQVDKKKIIMLCASYVDDTLFPTKKKYTNYVLNQFNNYDKNMKFTIYTFEKSVPHFRDI